MTYAKTAVSTENLAANVVSNHQKSAWSTWFDPKWTLSTTWQTHFDEIPPAHVKTDVPTRSKTQTRPKNRFFMNMKTKKSPLMYLESSKSTPNQIFCLKSFAQGIPFAKRVLHRLRKICERNLCTTYWCHVVWQRWERRMADQQSYKVRKACSQAANHVALM